MPIIGCGCVCETSKGRNLGRQIGALVDYGIGYGWGSVDLTGIQALAPLHLAAFSVPPEPDYPCEYDYLYEG